MLKNKKSSLIVLALSCLGFFLLSAALLFESPQNQPAVKGLNSLDETKAEVKQLNKLVTKKDSKIKSQKLSKQDKEELKSILNKRKSILLKEIKKNPDMVQENILPKETRDNLPGELKNLTEKDLEAKGKLSVSVYEDIKSKKEGFNYRFTDETNKKYNLNFVNDPGHLTSNNDVTLKGISLESEVVVGSKTDLSGYAPLKPLIGTRNTLVIRFNWLNDTSQPAQTDTLNSAIFSGPTSANSYFQETSYNNISFPGDAADITAYYTLNYNNNSGCSLSLGGDVDSWTSAADAAAAAGGHNLNNYQHIIYIFPYNSDCGWAGLATVGDDGDGKYRVWSNDYPDNWLFTHELGHNTGSGHANTRDCGSKTIDSYSNCIDQEYGDPYDTMGGYAVTYHMNAFFKNLGGWVAPSAINTVSAPGTYTLNPLENSGSTTKAIKIHKADTNEDYWLEYRQATGFDTGLSSGVTRGATMKVSASGFGDDAYLLDFTPSNNWSDVALSDGATFSDTANNIYITQTGHNSSSVTLSISFTPPASPPSPPTPPPAPVSPVYRFYNVNGTHFYTASEAEKNNIIARWPNIYHFEGFAYNVSALPTSALVYRFWNTNGTHFYTASEAEKNNIMARWGNIFKYEGLAYYVSPYPTNNIVYRFYNTNGTHFFTASASERDNVIARWPNIYQYEGTAWFLP